MNTNILFNAETLGLPQEVFEKLKHVVFTDEEKTTVKFSTTLTFNTKFPYIVPKVTAKLVTTKTKKGSYALNLIHDHLHEFNFNFIGTNDKETMVFYKEPIDRITESGVVITIPETWFSVYQKDGKWIKQTNKVPTFVYNKVTYTVADVAKMLNISELDLIEILAEKEIGEVRDPELFITSYFPLVEKTTNHTFINKTLINGVLYNEFKHSGKITCYNKTHPGYVFRWVGYNDGTGNFGEVWFNALINPGSFKATNIIIYNGDAKYDNLNHIGYMDFSKQHAIIELQLEELPAQGKNTMASGYTDVPTGLQLQRLPRYNVS